MVQLSLPYIATGKTIALTMQTFVGKVMSLLFKMLSRFVIAFLPRSRRLLIWWLLSPSAVIMEPKKVNSATDFIIDCIGWCQKGWLPGWVLKGYPLKRLSFWFQLHLPAFHPHLLKLLIDQKNPYGRWSRVNLSLFPRKDNLT